MAPPDRPAHARMPYRVALAWLALAALVVWLDWATKQWANTHLASYAPREIFGWLNLVLTHNTGAAFNFLSNASGWQRWFFTVLAVMVTLGLLAWLFNLRRGQWPIALALTLLIGGAIGNLLDRLRLGYVVDFVDVHVGGWHWPAFNVADSAITCGIIIVLLATAAESVRERRQASQMSD